MLGADANHNTTEGLWMMAMAEVKFFETFRYKYHSYLKRLVKRSQTPFIIFNFDYPEPSYGPKCAKLVSVSICWVGHNLNIVSHSNFG